MYFWLISFLIFIKEVKKTRKYWNWFSISSYRIIVEYINIIDDTKGRGLSNSTIFTVKECFCIKFLDRYKFYVFTGI